MYGDNSIEVHKFINAMYQYQKEHNIKNKCFTNSFILYNFIKENSLNLDNVIEIVPVFLLINADKKYFVVHNVVKYNGVYYDPSYEFSMFDQRYIFETVDDVNTFIKQTSDFNQQTLMNFLNSAIHPFNEHKKCAKYYMAKGDIPCDKEYIHKLIKNISI